MNTQALGQYLDPTDIQRAVAALDAAGYESLHGVLRRAFVQAAHGKGKERHAQDAPFDQQPMQRLIDLYGVGFALGQAAKKSQEAMRLPHERAVAELLGAIVYTAGAIIAMERGHQALQRALVAANDNIPEAASFDARKRAAIAEGRCHSVDVGPLCSQCIVKGVRTCAAVANDNTPGAPRA